MYRAEETQASTFEKKQVCTEDHMNPNKDSFSRSHVDLRDHSTPHSPGKTCKKKRVTILDVRDGDETPFPPHYCLETTSLWEESDHPSWLLLGRSYMGSITPESFFDQFIIKRRPCILTTDSTQWKTHPGLKELLPAVRKWKKNDYLKKAAGPLFVDVETSSDGQSQQKFGHGKRIKMSFGEFIDHIDRGEENLYLTTQKTSPLDLDSQILTATPLCNDFPPVPSIVKALCPSQYNLWFGHSKTEVSSGLHHDFHDNFYISIRGRKKFRIFSPRCAEILGVSKPIVRIHENGLITYEPNIRSDGFPELFVIKWKVIQAKHQIQGLQERLETVREAISVLRQCHRSIESCHIRQTEGGQRVLVSSGKQRRLPKRTLANSSSRTNHFSPHSKLSGVVTQGFLRKISKTKPKHAKTLLQQEIRSRRESLKLLLFYIREANEKLIDLRLQYALLKNGAGPEEPNLVHSEQQRTREQSYTSSMRNTTEIYRESTQQQVCSSLEFQNQEQDITAAGNSFDMIENSFSPKVRNKLLALKETVLAKTSYQKTENYDDTDSDSIVNFSDSINDQDDTENDEEDDDLNEDLNEDDFFTATFLKDPNCEADDEANNGNCEERPPHFCTHNTIERDKSLGPVVWGRFPKTSKETGLAFVTRYLDMTIDRIVMLQSYIELELNPGDMLYLPAGWFHEVFSLSVPVIHNQSVKKVKGNNNPNSHMALNYWFYPPHVCSAHASENDLSGTFENPYQDGFCSKRNQRLEMIRSQLQQYVL